MKVFLAAVLLLQAMAVQAAVDSSPKAAVVFVQEVAKTELFDLQTYPARITAKVNASILAETDGVVTRVHAPLGRAVRARERILTLTHTDPVYQYAPVNLSSPVSGVVSSIEVAEGTQVARGQKLASVTDPSQVSILVEIPAQDLASISNGLKGELKVPGRNESFPVRVRGISPFVDPMTGTATAELAWAAEKGKRPPQLPPGILGQTSFKTNLRKGISIPDHAVIYKGQEPFVRIVKDGKAKHLSVQLGIKQRGQVEVVSGLSENTQLIERSSRFVGDGDPVSVNTGEQK